MTPITPMFPITPMVSQLDFAGYAYPVEGPGPGKRLVIWVRGCHRYCEGCIATELWDPGTPQPVHEIARQLIPLLADVDGMTISGGEPFDQAEALCTLLDMIHQEIKVEVLAYTGYLREELEKIGGAAIALLQRIDILIDGPFIQDAPNTLQWRGSDNQRVHLLSKHSQCYAEVKDNLMPETRPLQIQMVTPTVLRIIGIPRRGDVEMLRSLLGKRGMEVKATDG